MGKSITAGLTLWAVLTAFAGEAQARVNYPWCAVPDTGVRDCYFSTREQCAVDERNRGFGGVCIRNPNYDPRKGPVIEEPIPGQPSARSSRSR
jgi:hypothetical protein